MEIAIVGAGIAGVTTAYELASDGHAVTVFEQHSAVAEAASFASAGLLAPLFPSPWGLPGPGTPLRIAGRNATLRLAGGLSATYMAWLWRARRTAQRHGVPATALERLAQYSFAQLQAIAERHELDFETARGRLILLPTESSRDAIQPAVQVLRDAGITVRDIDADAARRIEPGLSPDAQLAGALHLPDAGTGNCRLFAQLLRHGTQASGVRFEFNTRVDCLSVKPTGIRVEGEREPRRFDAVVLCAGSASAGLLLPLGLRLPMVAVHGYCISAPLREASHAPLASVVDPSRRISITRLGQRVRIAGGAELAGPSAAHHAPTLQRLYRALNDWFPGGAQLSSGLQIWRGAHPMLPDGAPVLGASGLPGLWLNVGHGASGWALACGSARALADLIAQREPEVGLEGLGLRRF